MRKQTRKKSNWSQLIGQRKIEEIISLKKQIKINKTKRKYYLYSYIRKRWENKVKKLINLLIFSYLE